MEWYIGEKLMVLMEEEEEETKIWEGNPAAPGENTLAEPS